MATTLHLPFRAWPKTPAPRRVRARGLQDCAAKPAACRPGAHTGRVLRQALKRHASGPSHCFRSAAYLFSPTGAVTYQPRTERSAALGWVNRWMPALKGHPMSGAARKHRSPLQGFGSFPTPTQDDALGWYGSAPLRLKTYPAARRPVLASRPCRPRSRISLIGTGLIPVSGVRQMRMVRCMAGLTHEISPSGVDLNDF